MTGEPIPNPHGLHKPFTVVPPKRRGSGRAWYKPNHRSFGDFMKSDQMRDVTEEVAEDIAELAGEYSPVSQRGGQQDGKRLRDNFTVKRNAGLIKVAGNLRVVVEVENRSRSAAPNEFGTSKNKRHRMLGRAGAEYGDFKPEDGPG